MTRPRRSRKINITEADCTSVGKQVFVFLERQFYILIDSAFQQQQSQNRKPECKAELFKSSRAREHLQTFTPESGKLETGSVCVCLCVMDVKQTQDIEWVKQMKQQEIL